jgi:hypothetical protein
MQAPKTRDPADNQARAARRAKTTIRRYCTANNVTVLWTLTYRGDGCHDRERALRDFAHFWRRMRETFGRMPMVRVPELHPAGHGYHVHFAVNRFLPISEVKRLWPHGDQVDVSFRKRRHRGRHGSSPRGTTLAGYVSKSIAGYVSKDLADVGTGRHSYEVAQGFKPASVRVEVDTLGEALEWAVRHFDGVLPDDWWSSEGYDDWHGPPVVTLRWEVGSRP